MGLGGGQLYPPQSGVTISNRGNGRVSFEGVGAPQNHPHSSSHATTRSSGNHRDNRDREARIAADRELAAFEALGLVEKGN